MTAANAGANVTVGAAPPRRSSARIWLVCAILGGVLVGVPVLLRTFALEAFQMPSGSMVPTFLVGDHFFCEKWSRAPARGDVVVFKYPLDPGVDYVKRVVALAGDTVEMSSLGMSLNGQLVPRRRVSDSCPEGVDPDSTCQTWEETLDGRSFNVLEERPPMSVYGPMTVPPGHVFLVGDNRNNSSDSRTFGPVPIENIKGRAGVIFWSRGSKGMRWSRVNQRVR